MASSKILSITPLPEYIKIYAEYEGDCPKEITRERVLFVGIKEDKEGDRYPVLLSVYRDGVIEDISCSNFKGCYIQDV